MTWRSRGASLKIQMIEVMFYFQLDKGIINLEFLGGFEFVQHLLYFVEIAAALNEFVYLLLESC